MISRLLSIASVTCLCAGLVGCTPPPPGPRAPATTPTTTTPANPTQSEPATPEIRGGHFTVEHVYEGECMPAGTRGGCHRVTLRVDGTFQNFLFDAAVQGTYNIDGRTVTLIGNGMANTEQLELSADGKLLGKLPLKP